MVKIKLCGLRRREDIELVNLVRPDYVGFVFAPGTKRCISLTAAAALKQLLAPGLQAVGVFVNASCTEVAAAAEQNIIDVVQLHGDENPAYVRRLGSYTHKPVFKAIRLSGQARTMEPEVLAGVQKELEQFTGAGVQGFLFDTYTPAAYGGTGARFSLELLRELKVNVPFFLAGGLNAANVGAVIRQARALPQAGQFFGVDVSGGVETDGWKDAMKVQAFCRAVRAADL